MNEAAIPHKRGNSKSDSAAEAVDEADSAALSQDLPHVDTPLSGWGNHPRVNCRRYRPTRHSELPRFLHSAQKDTVLPRGAGRSYGDAALNEDGGVIDLCWLDRFLDFDAEKGVLRCEAGVTVEQVLNLVVPKGWFLPVVPGTAAPTLGGLFAADVHGKNHHREGSFQKHVRQIVLVLPTGERRTCTPGDALFHATAGGMGLTGFVAEIEIQLQSISSAYIRVVSQRTRNLSETMSVLAEADRRHQYTVAWVDGLARGDQLGRGRTLLGDGAFPADLGSRHPFRLPKTRKLEAPGAASVFLNDLSMRAFNQFQHWRAPKRSSVSIEDYRAFFFPLDGLGGWNRLYGANGFVQYQFVIPFDGAESFLTDVLQRFQTRGHAPYLLVLKRFGEGAEMLSFPTEGWTLACDLPVRAGLFELLGEIDERLVERGGRVYLAKDCCLSADHFRRMYPEWEQFMALRKEVDPDRRLRSDLASRLRLL